jgi:hypothetical protein
MEWWFMKIFLEQGTPRLGVSFGMEIVSKLGRETNHSIQSMRL